VLIKGLFADQVDTLRNSVVRRIANRGPTSPPFPGHDLQAGQKLRSVRFLLLSSHPQ